MPLPSIEAPPRIASPEWRAAQVKRLVLAGATQEDFQDRDEQLFARALCGETALPEYVVQAYQIAFVPEAANPLKALLFASAPLEALLRVTGCSEELIRHYAKMYFDMTVFDNRLIKMAFASQVPASEKDANGLRNMLIYGLQLGWEYLAWRITGDSYTMSPSEAVRKILNDSLWRSRESMFSSLTSERTKEARAWVPQAIRAAESYAKLSDETGSAMEELRIHLVHEDETIPMDSEDIGELVS
jgi:hypothetical protein